MDPASRKGVPGYGMAAGRPTEESLITCADAVVRCLTETLGVPLGQGPFGILLVRILCWLKGDPPHGGGGVD